MADCCSRVMSTPLRMVFRGGSESLYRPAILAAVGKREVSPQDIRIQEMETFTLFELPLKIQYMFSSDLRKMALLWSWPLLSFIGL